MYAHRFGVIAVCLSVSVCAYCHFWEFGSGHEKNLMTCPCPKHWICGWVGNLAQVCSKLSYSFKNWDLLCMEGGRGVSFAYHPDYFSRELALLITCPPSLIEYLLTSWPLLTYSTVWDGFPKEFILLQLFIQAELSFTSYAHSGAGPAAPAQAKPWPFR